MATLENLKSWQPGQSGNPKGRPKGAKSLKTRLLELMDIQINYTDLDGNPAQMKVEDALGVALVAKALTTGDIKAIEMIKNELEANAPKDSEISTLQKSIVERAMARMLEAKDVTKTPVK
jgi:hypothetical protein